MLRVGLTGGIASGKSTVLRMLRELGAVTIDADTLAREVVEPGTEGLRAIIEAFGEDVLTADGELDRPRVADLVFRDPEARKRLEAIVHPRVRARAAALEEAARAADPDVIVVHDIPLLVETGQRDRFDVVVVVDASQERQLERLTENRGMSEAEARSRMASQATREDRVAIADVVIDNDGTVDDSKRQVVDLWRKLR